MPRGARDGRSRLHRLAARSTTRVSRGDPAYDLAAGAVGKPLARNLSSRSLARRQSCSHRDLCRANPAHLFADNAQEGLFPLWGFPVDILAQRGIDQRLIADLAARLIGEGAEIVDQVLIQPV
jgi:hypothetical protein